MDSFMLLNYRSSFRNVHGNHFPSKSKDNVIFFKMLVDLAGNRVYLVKQMQVGGDMKYS